MYHKLNRLHEPRSLLLSETYQSKNTNESEETTRLQTRLSKWNKDTRRRLCSCM